MAGALLGVSFSDGPGELVGLGEDFVGVVGLLDLEQLGWSISWSMELRACLTLVVELLAVRY